MRSHFLFLLFLWLECVVLAHAQRGIPHPDDAPSEPVPEPQPDPGPPGSPTKPNTGGSGGEPPPRIAGNPYAGSQGVEPNASPKDDEVDIEEIGEKLKDLIEDISSLIDAAGGTSASATATNSPSAAIHITQASQQILSSGLAIGCTNAQSAYATCYSAKPTGSSSGANFTSLPRTAQAGCLCNASPSLDFNVEMKECHDWAAAQNGSNTSRASQFRSYASVIANATALCTGVAPSGNSCPGTAGLFGDCPSQNAPSITPGPSITPLPPTGGSPWMYGGTGGRRWWYSVLPMALSLVVMNTVG